MKTFNTIACIIILVLALASAVFSYFLFEKRVQFVDGWTSMSTAIQTSAKKINEQSMDKSAGSKLTADALSHKNYEKAAFDATVKNLNTQSQQFVTQYENAVSERQAMSDVLSANSEKFASYGVKAKFEVYPEPVEEEEAEDGEESEEYVILKCGVDENGEDVLETIEDDDEFDRIADIFDDEFSDIFYDED